MGAALPAFSGSHNVKSQSIYAGSAGLATPVPDKDPDSGSLALFRNLVEGLRNTLERVCIGGLGAAARFAPDHQVGPFAHGIHHLGLFRRILNPSTVVLRVHRV